MKAQKPQIEPKVKANIKAQKPHVKPKVKEPLPFACIPLMYFFPLGTILQTFGSLGIVIGLAKKISLNTTHVIK